MGQQGGEMMMPPPQQQQPHFHPGHGGHGHQMPPPPPPGGAGGQFDDSQDEHDFSPNGKSRRIIREIIVWRRTCWNCPPLRAVVVGFLGKSMLFPKQTFQSKSENLVKNLRSILKLPARYQKTRKYSVEHSYPKDRRYIQCRNRALRREVTFLNDLLARSSKQCFHRVHMDNDAFMLWSWFSHDADWMLQFVFSLNQISMDDCRPISLNADRWEQFWIILLCNAFGCRMQLRHPTIQFVRISS